MSTSSSRTRSAATGHDLDAYPLPSVAVDVVLLTLVDRTPAVLLHRRPDEPYEGAWALPGGMLHEDERLAACAERVLRDKAGVEGLYLEQLYTFDAVDRDPRKRVISVTYLALADLARFRPALGAETDVLAGRITDIDQHHTAAVVTDHEGSVLDLAFDHAQVIATALTRLRGKLDYTPVGFQLLPERFTLRQLQQVHEDILGRRLDRASFRRRMQATGQLEATGEQEEDVDHRPAELYRFAGSV